MSAMKQVLDDVLDLQRMDSGRFESNPHAFDFHQCLKSMLGTLRVATDAKGLALNVELDQRIDEVLDNPKGGEHGVEEKTSGRTWVVGDSLRLRQVLSNFFSNAVSIPRPAGSLSQLTDFERSQVKFTPEGGGSIAVKTSLVSAPLAPPASRPPSPSPSPAPSANTKSRPVNNGLQQHHHHHHHRNPPQSLDSSAHPSAGRPALESRGSILHQLPEPPTAGSAEKPFDEKQANSIVVRIEVSDSGPGIRPSDATRLFEPLVFPFLVSYVKE